MLDAVPVLLIPQMLIKISKFGGAVNHESEQFCERRIHVVYPIGMSVSLRRAGD